MKQIADLDKMLPPRFSLIEILIAAGLVSIIGLSIASLLVSFHKENKSLSEKLESIEFEPTTIPHPHNRKSVDMIPFLHDNREYVS